MKKIMPVLLGWVVVASGCATSAPTQPMGSEDVKDRGQSKTAEERELAREWDEARKQLREQLEMERSHPPGERGGQGGTESLQSELPDGDRPALPVEPVPSFAYLRRFKPNESPNAYGADVLLKEELSEQELVAFVRRLAGSHDPVAIRIFTSRAAYAQEQSGNYGPEYDSDYILFYVRNLSDRGAYRGCNEIRWMQVTGRFSTKAGTRTKF